MNIAMEKVIKKHIQEHEDKMHPNGISRIHNRSGNDTYDYSIEVKELFNISKFDKFKKPIN